MRKRGRGLDDGAGSNSKVRKLHEDDPDSVAKVLRLPGLGNAIELGMLFDGTRFMTLGGLSLWDSNDIMKNQKIIPNPNTKYSVETSVSERRKTLDLSIEASLAISVAMFEVKGSGKYVEDNRSSLHESSVSASLYRRTQTRLIPQEVLSKLKFKDNLDLKDATHFVAEVEEGGMAAMTFKTTCSDASEKNKISGMLKGAIQTVMVKIKAEAKVERNETNFKLDNKTSIQFVGDYELAESIVDFESAMKEVGRFPERLKGITNTLKFKLLPLHYLDSKALKLCRRLSDETLNETMAAFKMVKNVHLEFTDTISKFKGDPLYGLFREFLAQVENFRSNFRSKEISFRTSVQQKLVKLKGDGDESVSKALIEDTGRMEFQCKICRKYIAKVEQELSAIQDYFSGMCENGFEVCTGNLPLTYKRRVFCIDVGILDNRSNRHHYESQLESCKKARRKKIASDWWHNKDITSQLQRAEFLKEVNQSLKFTADYKIGYVPTGGDESDSDDEMTGVETTVLYAFSKEGCWLPWLSPEIPKVLVEEICGQYGKSIQLRWPEVAGADYYIVRCKEGSPGIEDKDAHENVRLDSATAKRRNGDVVWFYNGWKAATEYFWWVHAESSYQGVSDQPVKQVIITSRPPSVAKRLLNQAKSGNYPPETDNYKPPRLRKDGKFVLERQRVDQKFINLDPAGKKRKTVCLDCWYVAPSFEPKKEGASSFNYDEQKSNDDAPLVIIHTGETGSGKTTQMNAEVNYFYGVELEDPFRLIAIDDTGRAASGTESTTKVISIYIFRTFPDMRHDFAGKSIWLVDSPGYGDTRGINADEFVIRAFGVLFKTLPHLNCVGFTVNSTSQRLTPRAKGIIQRMLDMFHKEISDIIVPICTFGLCGKPLCLNALKESNVPFNSYCKVSNGQFASVSTDDPSQAGAAVERKLYWDIAMNGIKSFFKLSIENKIKPLEGSAVVLQNRQKLMEQSQLLLLEINKATAKVASVKNNVETLISYLDAIPQQKVRVQSDPYSVTHKTKPGQYVTNCTNCNFTCHEICIYYKDEDKVNCSAMTNGFCIRCPGRCKWNDHMNKTFWYEVKTDPPKWIVPKELVANWAGDNGNVEKAILKALSELDERQNDVLGRLSQLVEIQKQISLHALRHNPNVLLKWIADMIENEKRKGSTDAMLQSLKRAKRELKLIRDGEVEKENQKKMRQVMVLIRGMFEKRSKLSPIERLEEEKKKSCDIYNKLYDRVPTKFRKKIPQKLRRTESFKKNMVHLKELLLALIDEQI